MAAISTLRLPDQRSMAEINITPLIDVMLALLLIFMLAAPMLTAKIPFPQSVTDGPTPRVLELSIAADGNVLRNGYVLSPLELKAELAAFASKGGAMSLQLKPDAGATHQRVIDIITAARDANIQAIALEPPTR
jgi:biopolymer transport protein ExbD